MTHTITLIPSDGIGPEVTAAILRVLEAAGVSGGAVTTTEFADAVYRVSHSRTRRLDSTSLGP